MSQKNNHTISEKIQELNELVAWFESDQFEIENAIQTYQKAEKLADEIKQELSEFKNKVSVVKKNFSE